MQFTPTPLPLFQIKIFLEITPPALKAVNFEFINLGFGQKKHNISTHIAYIRFVYMRFGEIIHIYPFIKLLLPVYMFIMYTIGAINRMKKK